jgi:type I restriction-modification system DNA methylase subunit
MEINKEMDKLENTINYIRSILRNEGITGMDSINHCLLFMIIRYLDNEKCQKLNIPEKYAFENLFEYYGEKFDNQKVYGKIYTKNQECLLKHLVISFKLKQFNELKLQSPINLENILKKIKEVDIKQLSLKFDIVGIIYELHLKTGTSSAMRDLGQYFTHRLVIEYMIGLCQPKLKDNKQIEKILDPSMGTAGFLTMSAKYLNNKYKNIDWNFNRDNMYGFDIDENVKNMGILNMLLETDTLFNNTLVKNDTLKNDYQISESVIIDKVDVILANEPFGLKNIIYKDCCQRIKDLKMNGTKAEPLFLQLMMISLNKNGRCVVIVPDGVLFNDAKLHSETRKYLIDNLNLKKVISLDGDFFLNTGVKSSILYFVNDGKTKETEFCKIKLVDNKIQEELVVKVNYDKLKENKYNLFVNKYNKVEEKKYGNIEYKKLEEVCDFLSKSKRLASFGKDNGKYHFYTSSKEYKYCDEVDYIEESIIIGTGGNCNIHYSGNFSCSADNLVLKSNTKNSKYIYYYLKNNINILEEGFKGSTIKHISKEYIKEIKIPIPSIEIQNQIIKQCEYFDNIIKKLELENESLLKYNYIDAIIKQCNNKEELLEIDAKLQEIVKNQN